MPARGGAGHRDGVCGLVPLRCLKRGWNGRADGLQLSDGVIDAVSLRVPPCPRGTGARDCQGDPALSLPERPLFEVKASAVLLKGGRAQAQLARGVPEREVEEGLERLVGDGDVVREKEICIISFFAARKECERAPPSFRHVGSAEKE